MSRQMVNILLIGPKTPSILDKSRAARPRNDLQSLGHIDKCLAKAERLLFKICWKLVVSRLVGEDSLTGFLFVYASIEALW